MPLRSTGLLLLALTAAHAQPLPTALQPVTPPAATFLALPAVAPAQLPLQQGLGTPNGLLRDATATFNLGAADFYAGRICVDKASQRVVWFDAIRPMPPLPATVLPQAQTKDPALAFAKLQAPELGADVAAECEDAITRDATWLWHFAKVVNGIRTLCRVDVGVRVYDGKVATYRYRNNPAEVDTSGVLSREAMRALAPRLLYANFTVRAWLEERCEVSAQGWQPRPYHGGDTNAHWPPALPPAPRVVWIATVDLQETTAPQAPLRELHTWVIEAKTGAWLADEARHRCCTRRWSRETAG